ncbi:MAG: type II toxin-antitoxin system HicA family toxin [Anaerolineae bacterium]
MPKLRRLSGRDTCRIMAEHGFVQVRRKGSHMIMRKKDGRTTITVPVPDHAELNTGTLAGIIRQSGLPRTLFEVD